MLQLVLAQLAPVTLQFQKTPPPVKTQLTPLETVQEQVAMSQVQLSVVVTVLQTVPVVFFSQLFGNAPEKPVPPKHSPGAAAFTPVTLNKNPKLMTKLMTKLNNFLL